MIYETDLEIANTKIKALESQIARLERIIKNLSSENASLAGQLDEINKKEGQDESIIQRRIR
jgi:predicted nuclease with TOPRIM domain